jgi:RNA polymerase subunit RPABC4/transcription elongation factor Spt4
MTIEEGVGEEEQTPAEEGQAPAEEVQAPAEEVQAPAEEVQAPAEEEASPAERESPADGAQTPAKRRRPRRRRVQAPAEETAAEETPVDVQTAVEVQIAAEVHAPVVQALAEEPLVPAEEPAPRTRTCRVCSVEINAGSARCPYCGARQFKHQPVLGWRGLLVLVVAVAAAVLITRAIIDAENGKLRYDSYNSVNLAGFVPSGWANQLPSGPHGTAIAAYVNPASSAETETITATLGASGSPHSRMLALYGTLANEPGATRGYHGSVTFPGANRQWTDYYSLAGAYYAVFFSDACNGAVGMTVKLSSQSPTRLDELALVVPWSAAPHCDGPAFSARDRTDPSVPLASR